MSENNEKTVIETANTVDNDKPAKVNKTAKKKKEKKAKRNPFGEMLSELKKVSWPTKADLRTYSICVLVFVVVCSIAVALIDLGMGGVVKLISQENLLPGWLNDLFGRGV